MILKKFIIKVFINKDKKQLMDYFFKYMKWKICVILEKKLKY
jgi:hypothetical protein